ncbi:MAG: hypothetical protein JRJ00_13870, partial [Deltaproteobacteria bacterium]|nr:hypothetical protein [Deltaproteobacteria bacterium]
MYCPKCNLHIEEYGDKCPLCGGPLSADEEMRGKTAQNAATALEWNRERIVAKGKEILGESELQEVLHPEESREKTEVPPPQEEEALFKQEKLFYQQDQTLKDDTSGSKKNLLIIGGGILIILILAVLGYFILLPSEEPSIPGTIKVAVTKKELAHTKPLASSKKPVATEQKEITENILQEPDIEKASLQPEKTTPSLPDEDVKKASSKTADTSVSSALSATPEEKYSIHVGSFKVKENAFDLRDKLQNKGYPILCFLLPIPGKE